MTTEITKQEMIDKIYEVIADKTLSFGCIIAPQTEKVWFLYEDENTFNTFNPYFRNGCVYTSNQGEGISKEYNIIGHPVMIGDVLDWIRKNYTDKKTSRGGQECGYILDGGLFANITVKWLELRKPIEDQSEECIRFIYNLIS